MTNNKYFEISLMQNMHKPCHLTFYKNTYKTKTNEGSNFELRLKRLRDKINVSLTIHSAFIAICISIYLMH